MKPAYQFTFLIFLLTTSACKKDFLDAKPSNTLVTPDKLTDFEALLENVDVMNRATPGLLQMAADDYIFVSDATWNATIYNAERNSYIWAKDLYEGQKNIRDWNAGYAAIFICNSVIEGLNHITVTVGNQQEFNQVKGWALFMRAYVLYDLARSFSPSYDQNSSTTDLGMPIRLHPGVDVLEPRSTVEETYNHILADLGNANALLLPEVAVNNKERPSKVAVSALFARIYLSMRNYAKAEEYAGNALSVYSTLIDYNTINPAERIPFSMNNTETILNTTVISNYYDILSVGGFNNAVTVNPVLLNMYTENDLRTTVYFGTNFPSTTVYMRFGYAGAYVSPFTGLATDELYLIKAECLARRNQADEALAVMNTLLKKRYKTGTFVSLNAANTTDALSKILDERRKELVWRSLRWTDLKRLNKEGANITLTRTINSKTYTIAPNDPRYIFPIPDDEIALSGIKQNIR